MSRRSTLVFGARATGLIVAACRLRPDSVVLLPALFCAEVADALDAIGVRYRCYDVPADLSNASDAIDRAGGRDVGALIVLHPFGLCRPAADGVVHPERVLTLDDACHALRTAVFDARIGARAGLTVFSPRKELGWAQGGVASGPLARELHDVAPAPSVSRRWRRADIGAAAADGLRATRAAAERLGERLPPLGATEVLSALPLKSAHRDRTIERLRRRGIAAWRWRRRLRGVGPATTPGAWALRRELFLVPLPPADALEPLLAALEREGLRPWRR